MVVEGQCVCVRASLFQQRKRFSLALGGESLVQWSAPGSLGV